MWQRARARAGVERAHTARARRRPAAPRATSPAETTARAPLRPSHTPAQPHHHRFIVSKLFITQSIRRATELGQFGVHAVLSSGGASGTVASPPCALQTAAPQWRALTFTVDGADSPHRHFTNFLTTNRRKWDRYLITLNVLYFTDSSSCLARIPILLKF